ncbi:MAG: helix-turn-helix transcriptional regulator [Acidobacteriota bacterium]
MGELELLVILAIVRAGEEPYANRVRQDLEENAERRVTRGALYRTLSRLRDKGYVDWEMRPSKIPERGGHPMRRLRVTAAGLATARASRAILLDFLEGLGPVAEGG